MGGFFPIPPFLLPLQPPPQPWNYQNLNICGGKCFALQKSTVFTTHSNTNLSSYTFFCLALMTVFCKIVSCILVALSALVNRECCCCYHWLIMTKGYYQFIKKIPWVFFNLFENKLFAIWNYFSKEVTCGVLLKKSVHFWGKSHSHLHSNLNSKYCTYVSF